MDFEERISLNTRRVYQRFLKPDWDGMAAHKYFSKYYDSNIYQKTKYLSLSKETYQIVDARNHLYNYMCMNGWEKSKTLTTLNWILSRNYDPLYFRHSSPTYRATFIHEARLVYDNIMNQLYPFQRLQNDLEVAYISAIFV